MRSEWNKAEKGLLKMSQNVGIDQNRYEMELYQYRKSIWVAIKCETIASDF